MKSIFDPTTREEITTRINSINESSTRQWGKMSVYQMTKHCTQADQMMTGRLKVNRGLVGRLFGGMFLKMVLKNDNAFGQNSPTSPELLCKEASGDVELQKKEWIAGLANYDTLDTVNFIHPFFGKMSKDQIGLLVYKHLDHHLRQFNS